VSNLEIGIWSFPVLLLLIFLRIPIGLAMLLVGIGGSFALNGSFTMILAQLKNLTYGTFSSYSCRSSRSSC
jgi:C4-dicarboxylate transporter DctM subunit